MERPQRSSLFGLAFATVVVLAACGDNGGGTDPNTRIQDVDGFLAATCEEAALCPGVSATREEINACPSEIRLELNGSQLTELDRFSTYTQAQQDCILECIGENICDRFGGGLSSISDSDVVEPFRACEQGCR